MTTARFLRSRYDRESRVGWSSMEPMTERSGAAEVEIPVMSKLSQINRP